MDAWILALRGGPPAASQALAPLGPPLEQWGDFRLFSWESTDPATTAQHLLAITHSPEPVRGALVLVSSETDNDARDRALALGLAATEHELLLDPSARTRLQHELLFDRGLGRERWTLPAHSVSIAPTPDRPTCREHVAQLAQHPPLVARQRELTSLLSTIAPGRTVLVRASPGFGGGRVITEAARRANATTYRIPASSLESDEPVPDIDKLLAELPPAAWWIVDPVTPTALRAVLALSEALPAEQVLVLRAAPETPLGFIPATRQTKLPPLREFDARRLVRSMLGTHIEETIVRRLAARAGRAPGALVEAVRASVQFGEVLRDGEGWIARPRRAPPLKRTTREPTQARINDLPPALSRALSLCTAVGDSG